MSSQKRSSADSDAKTEGSSLTKIGWTRPPQDAFRQHRLLFLRCGVAQASDLFRLARPLTRKTLVWLTRRFRKIVPRAPVTETGNARVFSVLDRLVPTSMVLQPGFLVKHSSWVDEAMKVETRTLRLQGHFIEGSLEEDGEFLYLPTLQRCYTLVWRWMSVLMVGCREPEMDPMTTQDCNEILAVLRKDFSLQSTTYLDLYPSWVDPREAGAMFERDRRSVRSMDSSNYRFKPWEGVLT